MHGVTSGWFNGVDPVDLLEINKVTFFFYAKRYILPTLFLRILIVSSPSWQMAISLKVALINTCWTTLILYHLLCDLMKNTLLI